MGRNGVLLLNIPPDKRGLITDYDRDALKIWRTDLDAIFKNNLLKGTKEIGKENRVKQLNDDNDATSHLFNKKGKEDSIELDLRGEKTFNVLALQENIRVGQRIENFVFEYWDQGTWKKATEGTTVGFKRLLEFPTITTIKVRLRILAAREQPALAEIGLYMDKNKNN